MVLNLFLALLLNSFNSEELKSKKEVSYSFYTQLTVFFADVCACRDYDVILWCFVLGTK